MTSHSDGSFSNPKSVPLFTNYQSDSLVISARRTQSEFTPENQSASAPSSESLVSNNTATVSSSSSMATLTDTPTRDEQTTANIIDQNVSRDDDSSLNRLSNTFQAVHDPNLSSNSIK